MKRIAVTFENGNVFQHFGHTEMFKFYDVENGEIVSTKVLPTLGQGHGALAMFLKINKTDALICGGIGGGAKTALIENGILLFGGVSGNADDAVKALIEDRLEYNSDVTCGHHDHNHGEGHDCSHHDCGGSCH